MKNSYWDKKFLKKNLFGEGPTSFATECKKFIEPQNVNEVLDLGSGQGRDSMYILLILERMSLLMITLKKLLRL